MPFAMRLFVSDTPHILIYKTVTFDGLVTFHSLFPRRRNILDDLKNFEGVVLIK